MNFDYTDDQKFLKSEARKFLEARCPPTAVRAVLDDPSKGYDAALWAGVAEQGWMGAAIPEEYGGLGLGRIELCAIAEELGRVCAPIPFASTVYFFAEALMLAGSDAQKSGFLPKIAEGHEIGCFATSEGPAPSPRLPCRRGSKAASSTGPSCRSPTATSPTTPSCWPRRMARRACSSST